MDGSGYPPDNIGFLKVWAPNEPIATKTDNMIFCQCELKMFFNEFILLVICKF